MPPKKTVVIGWGFKCCGFVTNAESEVTLIYCKICREYSKLKDVQRNQRGVAKLCAEKYIKGSEVIKKNNFSDHVKKSTTHALAVARISEEEAKQRKAEEEKGESSKGESSKDVVEIPSNASSGVPRQATMTPFIQKLNKTQHSQLVKKMQIAHFTATNAKSF